MILKYFEIIPAEDGLGINKQRYKVFLDLLNLNV